MQIWHTTKRQFNASFQNWVLMHSVVPVEQWVGSTFSLVSSRRSCFLWDTGSLICSSPHTSWQLSPFPFPDRSHVSVGPTVSAYSHESLFLPVPLGDQCTPAPVGFSPRAPWTTLCPRWPSLPHPENRVTSWCFWAFSISSIIQQVCTCAFQ
jgi:hypothetical protein